MKHRVVGRRLDRTTEHRTAMLRNMVTSLFRHERIVTTTPKAKELKRFADKMVTLAKRGTAHHRRIANRDVRDVEVLNKLFGALAGRFETRPGGYTRIVRVGRRHGDNADMSVIELVDRAPAAAPEEGEEPKKATKTKEAKEAKAAAPKKPKAEKAPKAEKPPKAAKPPKGEKKKAAKKAKDEE
jgi:large subunit ribosomal protein L17